MSLRRNFQTAIEKVVAIYGRIDLCWNNAGYQGKIKPTLEYDPEDFGTVMNVNVTGKSRNHNISSYSRLEVFVFCATHQLLCVRICVCNVSLPILWTGMFVVLQAVAKQMVAQQQQEQRKRDKDGEMKKTSTSIGNNNRSLYSICNTSSVAGLRGTPAMPAYSASKAAVLSMTVSCSKDLAPHGIRVNAVSPALIGPGYMWDRQNELHASSGSPYFATDPEVVAANKISSVPLKRLGSIEEVVKSVAFLLSDESSYTTGTNLVVDGGMSSGLRC